MHHSGDVFLEDDDDITTGGTCDPFAWVRVSTGATTVSIFGKDADQLDAIGEAFFAAARDLRAFHGEKVSAA